MFLYNIWFDIVLDLLLGITKSLFPKQHQSILVWTWYQSSVRCLKLSTEITERLKLLMLFTQNVTGLVCNKMDILWGVLQVKVVFIKWKGNDIASQWYVTIVQKSLFSSWYNKLKLEEYYYRMCSLISAQFLWLSDKCTGQHVIKGITPSPLSSFTFFIYIGF